MVNYHYCRFIDSGAKNINISKSNNSCVKIYVTQEFEKEFKALTKKNKKLKEAILKVIDKLRENPKLGKPLSHDLSGKWTIRVERVYTKSTKRVE